jgi:ribonuclease HI
MELVKETTDTQETVEVTTAETECGMVIYSDGSSIPNPGPGGSGNPNHLLTAEGYVSKSEVDPAKVAVVTPIHYIDGFGSFDRIVTNNLSELTGAYYALLHAADYAIKCIRVYTDSQYVRTGMENWVHSWRKYNWKRSNGEDIPNVMEWRRLVEQRDFLEGKGVKVEFVWVKAHDDDLGNEKADRHAMVGTVHSLHREYINQINTSSPDGYWKYETEAHPFLSHRCLYFNARRNYKSNNEYYLGYHGKEDDQYGNRVSDGAFAVVRLIQAEPVIETIFDYQARIADESDNLMKLFLENVFKPEIHQEISSYGAYATNRINPYRLDLVGMNDEPLTKEFRPAKKAFHAIENIGQLIQKLDQYSAKDSSITLTDLTPILYESVVKTSKKETITTQVLKSEYKVGFAALNVSANYQVADTEEVRQEPIILTLGIDLLDRNALKRLEPLNPKVTLITWTESELAFRHATVIEVDNAIGIWCGWYSNIRVISTPLN